MRKTLRILTTAGFLLAGATTVCLAAAEGGSGGPGSGQSVTGTQMGQPQTNMPAPGMVTPTPGRYGQVTGNPGYTTQTTPTAPTPDALHPNAMSPSGGGGGNTN